MNTAVKNNELVNKIFSVKETEFVSVCLEVFNFQYKQNVVYNQYCQALKIEPEKVDTLEKIPFLPISFFKTHTITTTDFIPEIVFESSGTTQTVNSKHFIKDLAVYKKSFTEAFQLFYGNPEAVCFLGLLPSYLERENSSLIMMVDELIKQSNHPKSGFYLYDKDSLQQAVLNLEKDRQKTLLIGVTFALLDFAETFQQPLEYITIMETGGMKGRREEITRAQVHEKLCTAFHLKNIHSEYGMTELLSQAYSTGNGIFNSPPWMKILIREADDPFSIQQSTKNKTSSGAINIIDLANIYSCAFIATDDAGKLFPNGSFEVLGRLDHSDLRGCSLLSL